MHLVFYVLIGLILLLIVSGGYTFFFACKRLKEMPWLDKDVIEKTPYRQYYNAITTADQWLKDHNAKDISVTSEDGLRLHGLWVSAENPRGTILLAHGYRSTYLVDFSAVLDFYHQLGMNLLIPQQRCHGKSEGKYITFGVKESKDMVSWLWYHNEKFGKIPVILSGLSMGASTVLFMADEPLPSNVRGIIADCGFTSPKEIIGVVFKRVIHLPPAPTLWVADLFARVFAGFSLCQKDSRKTLKKTHLPVLLVHGTGDDFVPCSMSKQAYEACASPKQLFLAEGAGHGLSFFVEKEQYSTLIRDFLATNIEN